MGRTWVQGREGVSRAQISEALIAKIIEERDILPAVEAGVRAEWFPEHAAPVWTWLAQYWQEHRVTPTMAAFRRQWGSLAMPDVADEPMLGLIREFRTARKAMIVVESLEEARKQISIIEDDEERSNYILKLYVRRALDRGSRDTGDPGVLPPRLRRARGSSCALRLR